MGSEQYLDKTIEVIRSKLAEGFNEDIIKKKLRQNGWNDNSIAYMFQTLKNELTGNCALRVSNVCKSFGQKQILDTITFDLNKGDLMGIIGLSGSGKTTLLSILIGFLEPDHGKVLYNVPSRTDFVSIQDQPREITKIFGYSPQKQSFYKHLSVWENLDYFGSLFYMDEQVKKKAIFSTLELVNLAQFTSTLGGNLSGGMQRRLGIACSLIHDPPILILDEPTADLDPIMRQEIYKVIRRINQKGKTVLITSHFLNELDDLCNHVAILHDRAFSSQGSIQQLKHDYSSDQEICLQIESHNYDSIKRAIQHSGVPLTHIMVRDNSLVIYTPKADKVIHELIHIIEDKEEHILDLNLTKPSLTEVFESVVSKKRYWTW
ncbi:MAG: ABC transporter ATP-binding protein [Candidatus Woesearchaeota archaeon]